MTTPSDLDLQRAFEVLSQSPTHGRAKRATKRAMARADISKEPPPSVSVAFPLYAAKN